MRVVENSAIPDNTPKVVTEPGRKYTRAERRFQKFVVLNGNNGLFVKGTIERKDGKPIGRFYDVPLEEASLYKFDQLVEVMHYVNRQKMEYRLCYKDGEGKRQVR